MVYRAGNKVSAGSRTIDVMIFDMAMSFYTLTVLIIVVQRYDL